MSKRHKNVFEEEDEQATGAGIISLILIIAIAIALVAVILFSGGCKGAPPRPQPVTPTIAPATPTPEPVTAPTSAGAPPWASACNLPPSSNPNCTHSTAPADGPATDAVWRVMQEVQAEHPEFFKPKVPRSFQPGSCEWILKKEFTNAYYTALNKKVEADFDGDLCSVWDGEQFNLKYSNDFSVSYHPIRYDAGFPPAPCLSDRNGIYTFRCEGKAGF